MGWLRHLRRDPPVLAVAPPLERSAPGVAALFSGIKEGCTHSVLDLGAASDTSLQTFGRFARRVRFADLIGAAGSPDWPAALQALPPQPDLPYDLVFAWDVLDRLTAADRRALVDRLAQVTAREARLHVVVDASERRLLEPLRFTVCDVDRIRYERGGPALAAPPPLLPAGVERVLAPFEVVSGFTLKVGVREYLAVRRPAPRRAMVVP